MRAKREIYRVRGAKVEGCRAAEARDSYLSSLGSHLGKSKAIRILSVAKEKYTFMGMCAKSVALEMSCVFFANFFDASVWKKSQFYLITIPAKKKVYWYECFSKYLVRVFLRVCVPKSLSISTAFAFYTEMEIGFLNKVTYASEKVEETFIRMMYGYISVLRLLRSTSIPCNRSN